MVEYRGKVTIEFLQRLKSRYGKNNYPGPNWMEFCEKMILLGWSVSVYRSQELYIFVEKGEKAYKIRFSNQKPAEEQQEKNDSDYYVGVSRFPTFSTEELIALLNKEKGKF